MSYTLVSPREKEDKRRGAITSALLHALLILLAILPLLTYPDPPPGQAGVLVSFGEPDQGTGAEEPGPPPASSDLEPIDEPTEPIDEVEPEQPEPEKPVTKPVTKPVVDKPVKPTNPVKEVETDKNSQEKALAAKKKAEQAAADKAAKAKALAEAKAKAAKEKAARDKVAAEKAAQEAAEKAKQAERDKWKNIGSSAGSGGGQGDGGKPGDQGQPTGDPDGKALDGISTGSGVLGGGISGRKVVGKPIISDRSQNTGVVNVKVCVDSEGNVVSAKYTQGGSTTTNATLIQKAEEGAKKYKFNKIDTERQCGTIKINFKVQ